MTVVTAELGTRAVVRTIVPGQTTQCAGCGADVKFRARHRDRRVVANVYVGLRWDRVEIWHPLCYLQAGCPHGEAAA